MITRVFTRAPLAFVLLLFWSWPAHAAPTITASVGCDTGAPGPSTMSCALTIPAGSNLALWGWVVKNDATDMNPAMNWNTSEACSQFVEIGNGSTGRYLWACKTLNPTTGAHNCDFSSLDTAVRNVGGCFVTDDTDQTTPNGTPFTEVVTNSCGTNQTINTTVDATDLAVAILGVSNNTGQNVAAPDTTVLTRANGARTTLGSDNSGANGTIGFDTSSTPACSITGWPINSASGGASPNNRKNLLLLGVGEY